MAGAKKLHVGWVRAGELGTLVGDVEELLRELVAGSLEPMEGEVGCCPRLEAVVALGPEVEAAGVAPSRLTCSSGGGGDRGSNRCVASCGGCRGRQVLQGVGVVGSWIGGACTWRGAKAGSREKGGSGSMRIHV